MKHFVLVSSMFLLGVNGYVSAVNPVVNAYALVTLLVNMPVTEIITPHSATDTRNQRFVLFPEERDALASCLNEHIDDPWFDNNGIIKSAASLFARQKEVAASDLLRQSQNIVIDAMLKSNASAVPGAFIVSRADTLCAAVVACKTGVHQQKHNKPLHKKSERERRQDMSKKHGGTSLSKK